MVKIAINHKEYEVPEGITLIQACDHVGIEIPRFCYHDRLSVAGNCRMCLVELEKGPPKPIASCATQVAEGMSIITNSDMVTKARKGVMEFLLANHPLDCPICDQGGECDLQDQSMFYGAGFGVFKEGKRAVKPKEFGPLIQTFMNRCIHCTRCVRFSTEIAGVEELGALGRGENMEIEAYIEKSLTSELSGNVIDLCPVGALTSKPYAFTARPWELKKTESIDIHDALGSNIRIDSKGAEVMRILPRLNEDINEEWLADKARFAYDGLRLQRLDQPYIRKDGNLVPASWHAALQEVAKQVEQVTKAKKEVAALCGDLANVESIYVLKQLMQDLGSANYDCRPAGSIMGNESRADYLFNTSIAGIEEADLCLLIGVNPRREAALLNARLRKRYVQNKNFHIANLGVEQDLTYPVTELGAEPQILEEILSGKHKFAKQLKAAKKPLIIVGEQCYIRPDAAALIALIKQIVEQYKVHHEEWQGFNVLHNAAARVGALDLNFLPAAGGKDTAAITQAAKKGEVGLVFLLGYDAPQTEQMRNACKIYIGSHGDVGASSADIILPSAAYTEKSALYVNTEGRVQRAIQAVNVKGEAKIDWEIINLIKQNLGFSYHKSYMDLYRDLLQTHPHFAEQDELVREFAPLSKFSSKQKLTGEKFTNYFANYYLTNVIAKASQTMVKCLREITDKEAA